MDLISREKALADDGLAEFHRYDDYSKMREYLKSLPSAFEGMTNGDVIKAIFPNAEVTMPREPLLPTSTVIVDYDENYHNYYRIGWWDSPYKGVSE